jgi:hypothetical protein
LSTERKTPLRDAAPAEPARATKTETRSRVARRRAVVGAFAALVIAGGGVFLLTRGSNGALGILGGSQAPPSPVSFTLKKAAWEATAPGVDRSSMSQSAKKVSTGVKQVLDSLFTTGYTDPGGWGDAGDIQDLFVQGAAANVEQDVNVLTLGEGAGDIYDGVEPSKSPLAVRTLTNQEGKGIRAYADATFSKITVSASFFLIPDGDGWKIEAYRADRSEKPYQPPATATPTAEAS